MTKEELMDYVSAYIIDGSRTWEETRDHIVSNIDDFASILEGFELSAVEFHCVLPFLKEVFINAAEERINIDRTFFAMLKCRVHYAPEMKNTPMENFISLLVDLLINRPSSREEVRNLNSMVEMLIFALLGKSRKLLEGTDTI